MLLVGVHIKWTSESTQSFHCRLKLTSTQPNAAAWIWNSTFLPVFFYLLTHKLVWQSLLVIIEIWNHEINSCVAVDSMYTKSSLIFSIFLFVGQCCCRFEFTRSMKVWLRGYSTEWSESVIERLYYAVGEKNDFQYFYMQSQSKSQWKYWFFFLSTKHKLNKWKCFTDLFIFRIFPLCMSKKVWTFYHSVNSMHTKKNSYGFCWKTTGYDILKP